MKTFTINTADLEVAAYATQGQATLACAQAAAKGEKMMSFSNFGIDSCLREANIKAETLWNTLPGVTQVKKFMSRATGIARILKVLDKLEVTPVEEPKPEPVKKVSRKQMIPDSTESPRATKRPTTAHTRPTPRDGSKQAQVVEMMKQPAGATLDAIMEATG